MTMLNELKSGDIARVVAFHKLSEFKMDNASKKIFDRCILRVISFIGLITFKADSKIFSVSKNIAKNIRVIKLK